MLDSVPVRARTLWYVLYVCLVVEVLSSAFFVKEAGCWHFGRDITRGLFGGPLARCHGHVPANTVFAGIYTVQ